MWYSYGMRKKKMCTSKHQTCCLLLGASVNNQLFLGVESLREFEFEGLADAKGRKVVSEWQDLSLSPLLKLPLSALLPHKQLVSGQ